MMLANGTDARALGRPTTEQFTIALVGGGDAAAAFLRELAETDNVSVAAVCSQQPGSPAQRLAEERRIFTTRDVSELFQVPNLDLVVDMSESPETRAQLMSERPADLEILGSAGSGLVRELLLAKKRGEEQQRLLVELQAAYNRIRDHEKRLEVSGEALRLANVELEGRLAEISFTHEYIKALASYITIDDICSLIVDGCNGILGAEISCVYLFDRDAWTLQLRTSQGRPHSAFKESVPVSETILGKAFREGVVQEPDAQCPGPSTDWLSGECGIGSQTAMALRSGEQVIGVVVLASTERREFTGAEMRRLAVLGNQSSLSLENALLHSELERLSVTDRLTDLYNHGHLKQRLDEEFKRAARFGHCLSLIMLDLDDFKAFNDTFGHTGGDALLKAVSAIIRDNLRTTDVAARYGGEEFVVVLPETDTQAAAGVAERIREGVESLRLDGPDSAQVSKTVSAGVATFPHHAASALRLLESADAAMYRAKRAGKNRVVSAGS